MTMIRYEVRDSVAEILLDNAPVNALTMEMMDALLAALQRAGQDAEVRAVIIVSAFTGALSSRISATLSRTS